MPFNNTVPTYESLLVFQEVYLLAVALSWKDEKFKEKLKEDPLLALEHYFGYRCPWNLTVSVAEPDTTSAEEYGWNTKYENKWHLPNNSITFGIPVPPEKNEEVCIALASYNDAGPSYLFSCC
jgi:ribosomally synthesized peptide (two-chain TOMM family)